MNSREVNSALGGRFAQLFRNQEGQSVIELALVLVPFMLLLVGAADFGRGYYLAIEVESAAEAGAIYGTLNQTDTSGMKAAALLDANDVPSLSATATYGCECSDGTSATVSCSTTPSCTVNVVNYVEVDTSATYTPIMKYPGIPSSFALTGKGRMRSSY
jgi:Flp pilus assembly protein TadG